MKRSIVFISLAVYFLSFNVIAGTRDMFHLCENSVTDQFQALSELEDFVNQHEGVTLSEMKATENALCVNINSRGIKGVMGALTMLSGDLPLGISGFTWGICLGVVGVAIVNFSTDDKEQRKKAATGCCLNTGVVVIIICVRAIYDIFVQPPSGFF